LEEPRHLVAEGDFPNELVTVENGSSGWIRKFCHALPHRAEPLDAAADTGAAAGNPEATGTNVSIEVDERTKDELRARS
jgi:hypothetical protein